MFLLSPTTKVFLARQVTDMRKSFRGLLSLTEAVLQQDPASGHLFVFVNGRRDLLKILHWDGNGYWIWYRRLERGRFQLPAIDPETTSIELTPAQLSLILDGIDLNSVRQRLRYRTTQQLPTPQQVAS